MTTLSQQMKEKFFAEGHELPDCVIEGCVRKFWFVNGSIGHSSLNVLVALMHGRKEKRFRV
ncbi:MAG: hypothetical protein CM15mV26_1090 [uncultured marine virus]|nr:MAG: hypothetical protein CM15mV26_1090 [uncultured marine virus]